jgi:hypothetical protein
MHLSDLFNALSAAGVRLARIGTDIKIRGPVASLTPALTGAIAEHKPQLLALLPEEKLTSHPTPFDEGEKKDDDAKEERRLIEEEGKRNGSDAARMAITLAEWDSVTEVMASPAGSLTRFDWRLEWLIHVGILHLRLESCTDPTVRDELARLASSLPRSEADWQRQGQELLVLTDSLRRQKRLPGYHWPARSPDEVAF